jgi:hypothetical protein
VASLVGSDSNPFRWSESGRRRGPSSRVPAGARVGVTRNIAPELVSLPDGFITGFNRADDEARFYVTPQVSILITPKMLGQSIHDYD